MPMRKGNGRRKQRSSAFLQLASVSCAHSRPHICHLTIKLSDWRAAGLVSLVTAAVRPAVEETAAAAEDVQLSAAAQPELVWAAQDEEVWCKCL